MVRRMERAPILSLALLLASASFAANAGQTLLDLETVLTAAGVKLQ